MLLLPAGAAENGFRGRIIIFIDGATAAPRRADVSDNGGSARTDAFAVPMKAPIRVKCVPYHRDTLTRKLLGVRQLSGKKHFKHGQPLVACFAG